MKARIIELLEETVSLLDACSCDEQAEWFRAKRTAVARAAGGSISFEQELKEVYGVLSGMGSFSDLPLCPKPRTSLSREEARARKWELAEALSAEVERLLDRS